jgi:NTP pyrophosphatase (non-canonical NTP hydrolase)
MENYSLAELKVKIEEWADNRGLIKKEFSEKQYLKYLEEVGETARAVLKNDLEGIIDGFGDIAVTVIILSKQLGENIKTEFRTKEVEMNEGFEWFMDEISSYQIDEKVLYFIDGVSSYYGHSIKDCLNTAWNEIKNREGKLINGTFVKN